MKKRDVLSINKAANKKWDATSAGRTSSALFFPFLNKLRNPVFFLCFLSPFGSSTEAEAQNDEWAGLQM